ncbi:MAG: RNA 2',3'-cyclic phosphodiesterase [Acidobacteria bacterium]|nr:RNA 2',3'-cyclic phosphodiesterase [Acidobacteriota bacterium]
MSRQSLRDERWRVFCAVELPAEVRARVASHIAALRESFPKSRASWARAEALHITLKFLGEIALPRLEALSEAAEEAVSGVEAFELAIEETGSFPPRGNARVLWLGVKDASGLLSTLQQRLDEACARAGFERETRGFHPHLTVARLRAPAETRELAALHREMKFERAAFVVKDLVVMRSELGAGGSRYTAISRHELREGVGGRV